jgi:uncharacterized membrane protein YgcG
MNAFDNFFAQILVFINVYLVQVILAVAFLVFFWGLYTYFIQGGADEEKRKQGRQLVIWGLVGFVIMVSLWSIVNLVSSTFNLRNESRPSLPSSRGGSGGSGSGGGTGGSGGTGGLNAPCPNGNECRPGLVCDRTPSDGRRPQCVNPG